MDFHSRALHSNFIMDNICGNVVNSVYMLLHTVSVSMTLKILGTT